ncbi:hypothetical protein [Cognaticolwellia mytili]|uniref:hypothetical protein n=1 Tax=Cognaticolwellia mytili TaxID=1888913 RepID=UPI000A16EE58|nr:hypothetical protein [Cognaticolwellia mytili]
MSLTPEQTKWLSNKSNFRCILVEVNYLLAGVIKTLYLSNHAFRSEPTDALPNKAYKNWLNASSTISFSQRMSVALFGKTQTGTSAIEFFLHPSIEHLITDADFNGQPIKVLIGDPTWPREKFITKFLCQGKIIEPVDDVRARITFVDMSESLKKGALSTVVTAGPSKGEFKSRALGQCFNVEPLLIDAITRTYQVNDGEHQAITAVRENGFVIAPSNYTLSLITGTLIINKNVTGRITVDIQGAKHNGTYITTAEQMINYLLNLLGIAPSIDSNVLPTYTLGLYIKSQRDVISCIDEICKSVGANWYFDELGRFRLQLYTGKKAPTNSIKPGHIKAGSMRVKKRLPAVKKISLGYQRNWTEQTDGIAAAITESNPELANLYRKKESLLPGTNVVANAAAAVDITLSTLIVNAIDAQTELTRRLALSKDARTIYSFETPLKKHNQGETSTVKYSRYFANGKDAVLVGHVHKINNVADVVEVLA